MELTTPALAGLAACFIWSGFVRSGFGFGGLVLMLPLALLFVDSPIHIIPITAVHVFITGVATVLLRFKVIVWRQLFHIMGVMVVPVVLGLLGLITLPDVWLVGMVQVIVALYAINYIRPFKGLPGGRLVDYATLAFGGYLSGLALLGSPLIVPVAGRWIERERLRDSLLTLWVLLAPFKIVMLFATGVDFHWDWQLWLFPVHLIGYGLGLLFHAKLLQHRSEVFYRIIGWMLLAVVAVGLWQTYS
ncbi:MAG: TSUP family transporter [SAR324 cluster bacterium]|nr:TSUP family transporter [SAR324 cluster bacterium]